MAESLFKVGKYTRVEGRYPCVYEGIDVEQYISQLIAKMKKLG